MGVLVSGRGSNLQSVIDAIQQGRLQAEIKVVISDVQSAYALERARANGIRAFFLDPCKFASRAEFDQATADILIADGVDLVVLAGFMRILSSVLIESFPNRIMNIHPALLPSFPGLHVQDKALDHGVKFSGCTVHFVDGGVDTGPIIIQAVVPIRDDDTEETLSARILDQEHRIYPRAIQLFSEGRLSVKGRRVFVDGSNISPTKYMINPPLE